MRTRIIVCGLMLAAPGAARAQYAPGFVWNQRADWTPGTITGSTLGNPDDDRVGSPVWHYQRVQGGALGSTNPWYAQAPSLLNWQPLWFGRNDIPAWRRAANTDPEVARGYMQHMGCCGGPSYMPMLRWRNPTGRGIRVSVTGALTAHWRRSCPVDVDVALTRVDASGTTALLAQPFSKPTNNCNDESGAPLPLDLCTMVEPDAEIVLTIRARSLASNAWVVLTFYDFTLTYALPAECAPNCDDNCALDIFDFLCFQNRFDAGDPYACDCDTGPGPGVCDIFDFLCFQNAFAGGCP